MALNRNIIRTLDSASASSPWISSGCRRFRQSVRACYCQDKRPHLTNSTSTGPLLPASYYFLPHFQSAFRSTLQSPFFANMSTTSNNSSSSKSKNRQYHSNIHLPQKWPRVTLYGDANMRPFRNLWMLEELGLPYRHIPCKPWSRLAKSVHPLGKVPALVVEYDANETDKTNGKHEDTSNLGENSDAGAGGEEQIVILESAAINTFLGDLSRETLANKIDDPSIMSIQASIPYPIPPVLVPPPATPNRALYDSLTLFVMTELDSQSLWIHRKHSDLSSVFGEAPTAVKEAKRQFDNALGTMEGYIPECDENADDEKEGYLIPSLGFSAVDILFANCCFWAQQIGWLDKKAFAETIQNNTKENSQNGGADSKSTGGDGDEPSPRRLSSKLESYLKRIRSRVAFRRANELRKQQDSGTSRKLGETVQSKL